jgi:hypothetical protein
MYSAYQTCEYSSNFTQFKCTHMYPESLDPDGFIVDVEDITTWSDVIVFALVETGSRLLLGAPHSRPHFLFLHHTCSPEFVCN